MNHSCKLYFSEILWIAKNGGEYFEAKYTNKKIVMKGVNDKKKG